MAMSAIDKLAAAKPVKIVRELPAGVRNWAPPGGSMVVVNAKEVDQLIRRVPRGRLTTLDHIRSHFAERFGTSITCPVSTAIFINIAARAAEEMRADGMADVTPWWRVLRPDGSLNEKYPGGTRLQRAILVEEGHEPAMRGKHWFIPDHDRWLADLT